MYALVVRFDIRDEEYEVYRDRHAFQAHEDAQHVKDFHAAKNPLLAGEHRVEFLAPGPAKGLPVG